MRVLYENGAGAGAILGGVLWGTLQCTVSGGHTGTVRILLDHGAIDTLGGALRLDNYYNNVTCATTLIAAMADSDVFNTLGY